MPYEKVGKNEPVCIADEVPFEIPDSWEWVRLGTVFNIEMGQSPAGNTVSSNKNGIEFHQGKVHFGEIFLQESGQYTSDPKKYAEQNSVLLCVRAPVGKVNITRRKICIGRGLCAILPFADMPLMFLYYLLEAYENIFVKQATGTTFISITAETVKNQLIPLPPLEEQKRIADKISELYVPLKKYGDVEFETRMLNSKFPEQLKKSILQWAVQGKLVPQDPTDEPASILLERIREEKQSLIRQGKIKKNKHESVIFRRDNSHYEKRDGLELCIDEELPFELPETWIWCRLGSILEKLTDGTHSTPKYTESGVPFISVKDISGGSISFDKTKKISLTEHKELYKRCDPKRGDILLTKVGTTGIPVLVDTDIQFSLFVSVAQLRFSHHYIDKDYLLLLLNSPLVQRQCTENTRGVGNKNWVMRDIANTLISLPPLAEQKRIAEFYRYVESYLTQINND